MGCYSWGGMYIKDALEMDKQCEMCKSKSWCERAFKKTNESGCIDFVEERGK